MPKVKGEFEVKRSVEPACDLAIPPGPDEIGEFYVYFNWTGQIVVQATMSCEGVLHQTGVRTNLFGKGYFVCNPD